MNEEQFQAAMVERNSIYARRYADDARLEYLDIIAFVQAIIEAFETKVEGASLLEVEFSGEYEYDDEGGYFLSCNTEARFSDGNEECCEGALYDAICNVRDRIEDELRDGFTIQAEDVEAHPDPDSLAKHLGFIR